MMKMKEMKERKTYSKKHENEKKKDIHTEKT